MRSTFSQTSFLADITRLACTAVGGSEAHLPMFLHLLVYKRGYLSEEELLEKQALCQMLPGPTSTQLLVMVAYARGGGFVAMLTGLIWACPGVVLMFGFAWVAHYFSGVFFFNRFVRLLEPMAVSFIVYAVFILWRRVLCNRRMRVLAVLAAAVAFFFATPYVLPLLLIVGALIMGRWYKQYAKMPIISVRWPYQGIIVVVVAFILVAWVARSSQLGSWVLLEQFFRNGLLVFGGGQALIPFLFTEFVTHQQALRADEFLSAVAFAQAIPGPIFALNTYVGAMIMRDTGGWGQVLGAALATFGAFVPGVFLAIRTYRWWSSLRQYRVVRAAIQGIHAVSIGFLLATAAHLWQALLPNFWDYIIIALSLYALIGLRLSPIWLVMTSVLLAAFGVMWN